MEDNGRRRRLGKSPAAIPFRHSPPPFKLAMADPSPLSMEIEMGCSNYNSNDVIMSSNSSTSQEATGNMVVDLNIPLDPLGEIDGDDDVQHHEHDTSQDDEHDDDDDGHHLNISPFNYYNLRPPPSPFRTRQQISALDQALEKELKKNGPTSDLRKLRRTISNRLSAQRSRTKKAQYLAHLEQKITELQEMIAILNPRIENYKSKRGALLTQKANLEQQLHDCTTISNLCNVEIEKNKREVHRLKEELQKKQIREQQMMFTVSNFGMQGSPYLHHHHHHALQPLSSSSFCHHQYFDQQESNCNIDSAVVDQYINFDALN